jgi:pimeloyl-ACP methyl ester carboxylesterase
LIKSPSSSSPQTLTWRIPLNTLSSALHGLGDFPFKDPDTTHFTKRTLFVRGTKSHYVADETLPVIGRFFPRFELRDIDCGHWVVAERPEEFKNGMYHVFCFFRVLFLGGSSV